MARKKARKNPPSSTANAQTRVKGQKLPSSPRKKRSRARAKDAVLGPKQPQAQPRRHAAQQLTGIDSTTGVRTRSMRSMGKKFKSPPLSTGTGAVMQVRNSMAQSTRTVNSASSSSRLETSQKNIVVRPLGVTTPLEDFFLQYPKFQYQPSISPVVEFDRLCKTYKWKGGNPKRQDAREAFNFAMKEEFNDLYGSDEKDIANWHKLCHVLRINPVPDTLEKCRAAVLDKHVNLVDLVHGSKVEVQIFKTEKELSEYTKETEKYSEGSRKGRWGFACSPSSHNGAT